MSSRLITRDHILPMERYAEVRDARRRQIAEMKKNRRVHVGPDVTFYFENFDTMLHQVHEMLAVEKGGEAQIEDELRAYNPLVPNGREFVATMMIEIDDPGRRDRMLRRLGGIESTAAFTVAGETITAVPESDIERTTKEGKTSSVHFLRFRFQRLANRRLSDARRTRCSFDLASELRPYGGTAGAGPRRPCPGFHLTPAMR